MSRKPTWEACSAAMKRGQTVYVALIERDHEGEEFVGVYADPEDAKASFVEAGRRPPRWKYDRKAGWWTCDRRSQMTTFVVRRERIL